MTALTLTLPVAPELDGIIPDSSRGSHRPIRCFSKLSSQASFPERKWLSPELSGFGFRLKNSQRARADQPERVNSLCRYELKGERALGRKGQTSSLSLPITTSASFYHGYKSQCIFPLGLTGVELVSAIYIPDQADGDQWMFDLTGYIPVSVLRECPQEWLPRFHPCIWTPSQSQRSGPNKVSYTYTQVLIWELVGGRIHQRWCGKGSQLPHCHLLPVLDVDLCEPAVYKLVQFLQAISSLLLFSLLSLPSCLASNWLELVYSSNMKLNTKKKQRFCKSMHHFKRFSLQQMGNEGLYKQP